MLSSMKRLLIGKPLKSNELGEQKLNKTKALAILSSDALSSVAYGPEQILIVLVTLGTVAFWYSVPIAMAVLVLLTALIMSYKQIIFAYPHGGGAYVVSKTNLGVNAGLVAGGSLLVDYILTVAVSVSAGTDALTSAFPMLHPDVRLVTLYSHYRSIISPLTKFIGTVEHKASESNYQVTVVIPQFITKKGWHHMLHNQSGLMIRSVLLYRRKVVIATVPYHLEK